MGTLNKGAFMAAAMAGLGIGGGLAHINPLSAGAPPMLAYHGIGRRSRTPGEPQPAGSKLARKASQGKVGIARIH